MALVVENETGQSTAESYVTVATYRAFWVARADTVIESGSTPTDAALEADLREGFAFVNNRRRFRGLLLVAAQAGAFPRQYLYDREGNAVSGVPAKVKEAQMRAARAHRAGELFSRTAQVGAVTAERVEGVVSVEYAEPVRSGSNDAFDLIDRLLDEYATTPAGSARLVRG